jgi:exoribonuclease-2
MSTVYMPDDKITMLPDAVVAAYTLAEGRVCAALSLYVDVDPLDWAIIASTTRIEAITIAHNLRHNALDALVTEDNLAAGAGDYPCKAEIAVLWPFVQRLYEQRQQARVAAGLRPETHNRADYNFYIDESAINGPQVTISERRRGAPLDKLVAELMILANSRWGKLLADHGIPGVYRIQQGVGAAGRVRMVTYPAPHQGLGVAEYAWSTSPLRRYIDLTNQWQLIACVRGASAPFKKNDAALFAIVSAFDAAYATYADFQATMERYWCLRWLCQQNPGGGARVVEALVQREDWVRMEQIPLQFRVPGLPSLARGTRVEIELISLDDVELSVACRLLAIIEEVDGALDGEADERADDISDQAPDAPDAPDALTGPLSTAA